MAFSQIIKRQAQPAKPLRPKLPFGGGPAVQPGSPDRSDIARRLRLVYIIGTYPSLTTTFIDREVLLLNEMDAGPDIISVRRPEPSQSPRGQQALPRITYLLPCGLWRLIASHARFAVLHPVKYLGTLCFLLTMRHPDWKARLMTLLHFGEGVVAAGYIQRLEANHIHAHFVDRAATLAMTASRLLDIPYSLTAHANDIYVRPIMLDEKIGGAVFAATCTRYNKEHLVRTLRGRAGSNVHCIYHGLDTGKYKPGETAPEVPPLLIAVGQLKEKKGFTHLLSACRLLRDRGYDFQCQIVGDGPLRSELQNRIHQLDLNATVRLLGALSHSEVVEKYSQASIFTLPCVVAPDGDRDGIPNVILEAMAMGLPVVATSHSGIPEVVVSGVNGLLVPPADETALADALAELLDHPAQRRLFGQNARRTVIDRFDVASNACKLLKQFITSWRDPSFRRLPAATSV
jgi:glycosyltransferase involved in cell wall biosynthesis